MTKPMLSLMQLCDSNFPTGSFSHSFGLESYIQENIVHDEHTFSNWLHVYLHEQLVYADGLAASLAYDALHDGNYEKVWELDHLLNVQNFARESREGTAMMGERMLSMAETLYDADGLSMYRKRIKEKQSFGHPALVFTIVGHSLKADKETVILYYFYSTIVSLVQNAVRAIPLGQTAGQRLIHSFHQQLMEAVHKSMHLAEEEFGIVAPGLELSQMQHERVNIRIFMS